MGMTYDVIVMWGLDRHGVKCDVGPENAFFWDLKLPGVSCLHKTLIYSKLKATVHFSKFVNYCSS